MERAVFGRALEQCRVHFLADLYNARHALVLGDGDGRFLQRLLDACPDLRADYVDRSAKMLEIARRRVRSDRVRFHLADVLTDSIPSGEYDLVATHFFFDCFEPEELRHVIECVAAAAPGARWVVSEFNGAEGWLALPSGVLISLMYQFFGMATGLATRRLTDHRPFMRRFGFELAQCKEEARGFLRSELWTPV
jgi:ubiquinone/menaquinone biosynthesis C-methylase UbiE